MRYECNRNRRPTCISNRTSSADITVYEDYNEILITFVDVGDLRRTATKEGQDALADYLIRQGMAPDALPEIQVVPPNAWAGWRTSLGFILPSLVLVGVFLFGMRR